MHHPIQTPARRRTVFVLLPLLALAALPSGNRANAADKPEYVECWKATFTEQSSGATRMRYVQGPGSDQDFIHSYDGPFRWTDEPKATPVTISYRYCFARSREDGGVVLLGDKSIPLGRVGSSKLPNGGGGTPGYANLSTRNLEVFDSLYGRFQGEGQKVTTLQIELDRQRLTTSVITHVIEGKGRNKQQNTTYMKGETVRVDP